MSMILDGKELSTTRLEILREKIAESGIIPGLATIIIGEDPASQMYVRMKHRACESVGIRSVGVVLPGDVTTADVLEAVEKLNNDPEVNGVLIQLPLPQQIDTPAVIAAVSPDKDVDGFHPLSMGKLFAGEPVFVPCTPGGIMTIFEDYDISLTGKRAVVIGRSVDVGRPMAALLLNANATVTICHSKTENLSEITKEADILVSAIGRARFVTADMVKDNAVVIDVGINYDDEGNLCGDVDFEAVSQKASALTPVPGGVGPMTIATLMENTWKAANQKTCNPAK